jgi:Cu(I)/Ag(I) efflux system membrane protein CusA/SilA
VVVPVTVLIIFLLLYLNFRRVTETLIVMLSVPFALVGGLWPDVVARLQPLGRRFALAGVAAETCVLMLIYLDNSMTELRADRDAKQQRFTRDDLHAAIMTGAVERVRPKMMTLAAIMAGLLPIMWSHGTGAEVMQRIAVPMIGGMVSSTLLTLIVIPAIYAVVKAGSMREPRLAPPLIPFPSSRSVPNISPSLACHKESHPTVPAARSAATAAAQSWPRVCLSGPPGSRQPRYPAGAWAAR